jgi:peptide/nickel transport system permease protein
LLAVIGVSLFLFFAFHFLGDPVVILMPEGTPQQHEELRAALGLADPLYIQMGRFFAGLVRWDFGDSYFYESSAFSMVLDRIGPSSRLISGAISLALIIGVPLGILAAIGRGKLVDRLSMVIVVFGQSMPVFWTGIVLILIVSVRWHLLPTSGYGRPEQLVLPILTLGFFSTARFARVTRASMVDVLQNEYIRTAHAKGLSETIVLMKHALRNAFIPVLTMTGLRVAELVAGGVIIETVFGIPGMGNLLINSVNRRDYPIVQAEVFLIACVVVAINLIVDLIYGVIDPRIRYD